jgi:membrane associated rhomboid family serine protease
MPYRPVRPGLNLGSRLTPAVTWILALSVGAFLLSIFSGKDVQKQIADWLILTPHALFQGRVWMLATTALFNTNAMSFFFNVLMLWMFVPVLEREWGTRRFVIFAVATTLVGNLVAALVGLLVSPDAQIAGLSPLIFASIAAFGTAYASQPVQFFGVLPMKGRTFALGVTAFLMISVLLNREWANGAGYLAAMAVAWAFAGGRLTPGTWLLRFRRSRLKKKLSVLDGRPVGRPPQKNEKKHEWLN